MKWRNILAMLFVFVMLKNGSEMKFSEKFSFVYNLYGIEVSDGVDNYFFKLKDIKWATNDEETHKLLKLRK